MLCAPLFSLTDDEGHQPASQLRQASGAVLGQPVDFMAMLQESVRGPVEGHVNRTTMRSRHLFDRVGRQLLLNWALLA
ncbi:hypothetical protein XF35_25360 [Streptomyces platensis subsp. clarensis]|nr:hypothetical protein [Streptomyces platensis subsp. clarensis]